MTHMERVHDTWSPLDYILDHLERTPGATWLDTHDQRRLNAYKVLAGYRDNIRARYLPDAQSRSRVVNIDGLIHRTDQHTNHYREYGDADLLITTTRALVLGETQTVEPADGTPQWAAQFWEQWTVAERWEQKLLTGEAHTATYGDGVYVLTPSPEKKRPRLRVYDPGFYFPDTVTTVPGWEDEDYPPIVHLAWEYEQDGHTWIRRSTWKMTPLDQAVSRPWGGSSAWTCLYRQVDYRLDNLISGATVYSPEISNRGVVVQDWTDLNVDFIPVVHVPNTPTVWGESTVLRVTQVLDDVQNTDTDLAIASQSASSTLVTKGATPTVTGGPGEYLGLPSDADAGWLDTSRNLDALLKFAEFLADRVVQNTRLSKALVGAIQPNEVPSGFALQLGFHAARQLMRELRTVRTEKHPLVLKFALRMSQAYGWTQPGEVQAPFVVFGASLPSDLASAVQMVKDLLPIGGMSTPTAVRVLAEAGVPVDDAEQEVEAIRRESYEAAVKLFEATGNAAAAAAMLGVDPGVVPPVTGV